jgi:N-acetylglucosaminyldiphosphoundecaprenol N-acetyl-beta-D-mannosaminyltransferase
MVPHPPLSTSPASADPAAAVRFDVLGVRVAALDLRATADRIEEWIATGRRSYVCHANVHGVMEAQRDPQVRAAYNRARLTVADGMPLVWLGRRAGHAGTGRVYGPDLMLELCARAARSGASCFDLGGAPGVAEALASALEARFPGLRTAGTYAPPFGLDARRVDADAVRRVNAAKPDILWVGLGCPRQELWMATHRGPLEASALIGVGAAFDFHTGRKRQAPRFMMRLGLEWLFRLLVEPGRLWYRYLVYNPWFVLRVAAERLGLRRAQPADAAVASERAENASQATASAAPASASSDAEKPGGR